MASSPRTWIELSGAALRHNLSAVQQVVGKNVQIMPVVKANAYGHGLGETLELLRGRHHWGIGVAYGEEASQARKLHYRGRVVALSNWQAADLSELIKKNIELAVWDSVSLQAVLQAARVSKNKPKVHLKLDTGTTRIGFLPSQEKNIRLALTNNKVKVVGIFSHFANAEEKSITRTIDQLKRFTTLTTTLGVDGSGRGGERHIACTAAILRYPEARFGLVRLGIGLYGLWPSAEIEAWSRTNSGTLRLRPVLSWYTRLAQVKTVPTGTGIGYGSTVVARRSMKVGVLPVGYADGYDRRLSNAGFVMLHGRRANIVGRVCMNLCMVDLTKIPQAKNGDLVTLIGSGVSADDLATIMKTINYDLVAKINWVLPRRIA